AISIHLCHTKLARIIYLFYPQHAVWAVDHLLHVVFANGISERNKNFIVANDFACQLNGMAGSPSFALLNKMAFNVWKSKPCIVLDFFTQVSNNENEFVDAGLV